MIGWLKALHVVASLALIGLLAVVYPGSSLTTAVGVVYLAAAVLAALDYRIGIWLALPFSVLAALFAGYGVYRWIRNGFNFLTGTDGRLEPVYLPPYLFALVAAASIAAVLLHLGAWRWFLHGRAARDRNA